METAKVFMSGGSQAVRLPKAYRFAGSEVGINRVGSVVVLVPKESRWQGMMESLDMFTDDFMDGGCGDLAVEERESL